MAPHPRGSATWSTDEPWNRLRRVLRALRHHRDRFFDRRHHDRAAPRLVTRDGA